MKLYKAIYQAVIVLLMEEPCGSLHEAACNGEFFIQAENEVAAEAAAEEIIEKNFLHDYISELKIEEVSLEFEASSECEKCDYQKNGYCILDFPNYEEDYAAQDIKEGD